MRGLILLCYLTTSLATTTPCFRREDDIIVELIGGQLGKNATAVDTVVVGNEDQCMDYCLYKGYCVSFNAIQDNDKVICELFDLTNHDNMSLVAHENSSYYEVRLFCQHCSSGSGENGCGCDCSVKRGCDDWYQAGFNESGVYEIKVDLKMTRVFCDMLTQGGGWIKFQNRFDGSVDFNKPWVDYKEGFGDLNGEFWLGLETLHQLTVDRDYLLYFEMVTTSNDTVYDLYPNFKIENEGQRYKLRFGECVNSTQKNCVLSDHINMKFSTYDAPSDNDCAKRYSGGWWYTGCYEVNLNSMPTHKWDKGGNNFLRSNIPAKTSMMVKKMNKSS